ncbi:MAG: hypothetical protein SGI73_06485 [Chloroflexota bacterium]|nr:hypothetical protein [Chloroflexota bacterium]
MTIAEHLIMIDEFEAFLTLAENDDRLFELINEEIVEKVTTR